MSRLGKELIENQKRKVAEVINYNNEVKNIAKYLSGEETKWKPTVFHERYFDFLPANSVLVRYFYRESIEFGSLIIDSESPKDIVHYTSHGAGGTNISGKAPQHNPWRFNMCAVIIALPEFMQNEDYSKLKFYPGDIVSLDVPLCQSFKQGDKEGVYAEYKGWFVHPLTNKVYPDKSLIKNIPAKTDSKGKILKEAKIIVNPDFGWALYDVLSIKGVL